MMAVHIIFAVLVLYMIVQRLAELAIAKRNTSQLIGRGGIEFGRAHYPAIVALHVGFFISLVTEYVLTQPDSLWLVFFLLFCAAQLGRAWIIGSMHGRWTTRVVVIPGEKPIRSGPFRMLKHPNYVIVAIELFALPMLFMLTATAVIFTVLNALILVWVRIPVENAALKWARRHKKQRSVKV